MWTARIATRVSGPSVPRHTDDLAGAHVNTGNMSGCPCHVRNLTVEHNRYLSHTTGAAITCLTCHTSTDPRVVAAIAAGSRACRDCHTISGNHPYGDIDHIADVAETPDTSGVTCGSCHAMDLAAEHDKASSSSAGADDCVTCHETPRDSFGTWGQGCSQGDCHKTGTATAIHGNLASAHALPTPAPVCTDAGCHASDRPRRAAREAATTTTRRRSHRLPGLSRRRHAARLQGVLKLPCRHRSRLPRRHHSQAHVPAMDPTCQGSNCHVNTLDAAHAKAIGAGSEHAGLTRTCPLCHGNAALGNLKDHTAACESCHTIHPDLDVVHTGITLPSQSCAAAGCHDTAASLTVHANSTAGPCAVCHGDVTTGRPDLTVGKTAVECADCHTTAGPGTAPAAYHTAMDASHATGIQTCTGAGCHTGAGNIAALHSSATTVTAGETRSSCRICHAAGGTPSATCADCHSGDDPHAVSHTVNLSGVVGMGISNDYHSPGLGSEVSCSWCHYPDLEKAHGDDCSLCHGSVDPNVVSAIANHQKDCSACHTTFHTGAEDVSGRRRHPGMQRVPRLLECARGGPRRVRQLRLRRLSRPGLHRCRLHRMPHVPRPPGAFDDVGCQEFVRRRGCRPSDRERPVPE